MFERAPVAWQLGETEQSIGLPAPSGSPLHSDSCIFVVLMLRTRSASLRKMCIVLQI